MTNIEIKRFLNTLYLLLFVRYFNKQLNEDLYKNIVYNFVLFIFERYFDNDDDIDKII
jgi:hypothetical protein